MANLSASYDKLALGLALVIALGLGAMVYMANGKAEEDFPDAPRGRNNPAPVNEKEEEFKETATKVGAPVEYSGPTTEDDRKINNFVGTPLFLKSGSDEPVDLGDASYQVVHPPIPNIWWLEHGIDPGYSDSPQRDADSDGFTNLDEYTGKTDPNDPKSYPALIAKLQCATLEKKAFMLIYSSDTSIGALKPTDTYKFKHEEVIKGRKKGTSSEWLQPGKGVESNVFAEGGAQLRYEFKKIEQRTEKNPRNGITETANYAVLEDVGGPKKGDAIELKKGSRNGVIIRDYTAVLALAAIGEQNNQFKIAERGTFSLPFDPNAEEKPFTFVTVNGAGAAVIEWEEDGQIQSIELTPLAAQP